MGGPAAAGWFGQGRHLGGGPGRWEPLSPGQAAHWPADLPLEFRDAAWEAGRKGVVLITSIVDGHAATNNFTQWSRCALRANHPRDFDGLPRAELLPLAASATAAAALGLPAYHYPKPQCRGAAGAREADSTASGALLGGQDDDA